MAEAHAALAREVPDNAAPFRPAWPRRVFAYRDAVLVFAVLLIAWVLISRYVATAQNSLLPGPAKVFSALWDALPELWRGTVASLAILVPGFGIATVLGVVLGLRVGTSERLRRTFFPCVRVAAPVPPTVYIPYAIAVLPTFRTSAIFVVFVGAFWPVFISAASGAHSLDARYRDNARILGLDDFTYHRRVVFPAALPHIFSGMGVGLGFSFILLTVAELFGANAGLGRFVQYYADFADYPRMVAGILYTGLVTFLAMTLLDWTRKKALFWLR